MKVINLLPKEEQGVLLKEKIYLKIRQFVILSAISYVVIAGIFVLAEAFLKRSLLGVDNQIVKLKEIVEKKDNDKLKSEVTYQNNSVIDYLKLAEENPRWSNIMEAFAELVPSDVAIENFNANTKSGKIEITGRARTRDAVLALRNNIDGSPLFKNINLPLENLQKPVNPRFSYVFYLNDGVLK